MRISTVRCQRRRRAYSLGLLLKTEPVAATALHGVWYEARAMATPTSNAFHEVGDDVFVGMYEVLRLRARLKGS